MTATLPVERIFDQAGVLTGIAIASMGRRAGRARANLAGRFFNNAHGFS